jgi:hypothetical protein
MALTIPFLWQGTPDSRYWREWDHVTADDWDDDPVVRWTGFHDTVRHETWVLGMPLPLLWLDL